MKINTKPKAAPVYTAQGGPAVRIDAETELRRSVMACMLWEKEFYEDGKSIAERVAALIPQCRTEFVAACAYEARTKMKLRHMPLFIVREMARHPDHKKVVKDLLRDVIQRADELSEFLAIYWKDDPNQPLSAQVKKGLAAAFRKFDAYQLAKYDRAGSVRLRDVLFLSHSKPVDAQGLTKGVRKAARENGGEIKLNEHEELYRKLVDGELETPDTWEVALSAGADKKETFERLMAEKTLGGLAFVRNLRNMYRAGIDKAVVAQYAETANFGRVLPFRFISAARYVPAWEDMIEKAMFRCLDGAEKLPGKTVVLIDVSASMNDQLSRESEMLRLDAAYGLAILLREVCEDVQVFTFSNDVRIVPPRRGFALRDAMDKSQPHSSTYLGRAVENLNKNVEYDRIITITDEQSADKVPDPKGKGYVINVASNKRGVGYGKWFHIDGWSEAVIDYIFEYEKREAE